MSIKGYFEIQKPDDVMMRMTLVMSVGEWKTLRETLKAEEHTYWEPAEQVTRLINDLVDKAQKSVWDEREPELPK